MAKIKFDIKYRQEIVSGKYKPILECGVEALILSWNIGREYPIVCMAKKDDGIPFRVNNQGIPMEKDKSRLYIDTGEEEVKLTTDFEKELGGIAQAWVDKRAELTIECIKVHAERLLKVARNQLQPEIDAEIDKAYKNSDAVQYRKGKEDALKDMPHWRRMYAGAAGSGDGRNIYLIRDGIDSYRFSPVIAGGDDYLVLAELDKLPKM